MKTLKQEIKDLKVGQAKIFKINDEPKYITIRKSRSKGLEIIIGDGFKDEFVSYEEIRNNFKEFNFVSEYKIHY